MVELGRLKGRVAQSTVRLAWTDGWRATSGEDDGKVTRGILDVSHGREAEAGWESALKRRRE